MKVKEVMSTDVLELAPATAVRMAGERMLEAGVGAMPVCDSGVVMGIVTMRDISSKRRPVGADPLNGPVSDIMTSPVVTISEDSPIDEAAHMMKTRRIRRLVVLDDSKRMRGIVVLSVVQKHINELIAADDKARIAAARSRKKSRWELWSESALEWLRGFMGRKDFAHQVERPRYYGEISGRSPAARGGHGVKDIVA